MNSAWLLAGSVSGFLAVSAGAFGAHGLRDRVDERLMEIFETAARYQVYHALALVLVALIADRVPDHRAPTVAGWAFVVGTIVFSGSLYALVLTGQRWLGAITPIGGLSFLVGWASLAWLAVTTS